MDFKKAIAGASLLVGAACVADAVRRRAMQARSHTAELESLELELIYFNFPGKADPIRLALHYSGRAFTDHRFKDSDTERAELKALKASGTLKFGQVPALLVKTSGKGGTAVLNQTPAILRFVGKRFGSSSNLYPRDEIQASRLLWFPPTPHAANSPNH